MPDPAYLSARLLVVDDEEANVDLLEQMLARAGYTNVVSTTDPRCVLELAIERPPDLILLDLMMPHLDGFAVMERLRPLIEHALFLPILVLTADITTATKQRALAAGAKDFLTKPFEHTELLLRIKNLLETRMLYRQIQEQTAMLERLYQETLASVHLRDQTQSVISHDLGQPLTTIRVAARVLRRNVESGAVDAGTATDYLQLIDDATTKMLGMIGELVDLARLQSGRPLDLDVRSTDLVALAAQEVATHQATTSHHRIRLESAEPELIGLWDGMRLGRVISNLLSNAVKFSPEGGAVTVTVARDEGTASAVLVVQDQGIGIPPADLLHISERFHRAANVSGRIPGSGLGLAGARQIVEQHGGSLSVLSREDVGTTVRIRLPLDEQ